MRDIRHLLISLMVASISRFVSIHDIVALRHGDLGSAMLIPALCISLMIADYNVICHFRILLKLCNIAYSTCTLYIQEIEMAS